MELGGSVLHLQGLSGNHDPNQTTLPISLISYAVWSFGFCNQSNFACFIS